MLKEAALQKYISQGEFEKAEKCGDFSTWDFQEYYDFLCHCVDKMKADGDEKTARSFIERKISFFKTADKDEDYGQWHTDVVKPNLMEYLAQ